MNGVVAWTEGTWKCGKNLSDFAGIDLILFVLLLLYNCYCHRKLRWLLLFKVMLYRYS